MLWVCSEVLGIGSYGKVCKAKCGQLPCAAKLLHDTLFQDNAPGTRNLVTKFLQECQFLSTIKHPSIVQYLDTATDPQSRRPVLLMELMDESLTRFLESLTGPLPYHSQLNICHDVALALACLHSNAIIHRDLSSNNVLLIGEGDRLWDVQADGHEPSHDPTHPGSWNTSLHASRGTHLTTSLLQQARLLLPWSTRPPDNHQELPRSWRCQQICCRPQISYWTSTCTVSRSRAS